MGFRDGVAAGILERHDHGQFTMFDLAAQSYLNYCGFTLGEMRSADASGITKNFDFLDIDFGVGRALAIQLAVKVRFDHVLGCAD